MSKSRVGSLGRRLSSWLALQSLASLAVVCVAVYAVTYAHLAARQLETIAQKETQVRHLLAESARDGDVGMLRHKLDDFFIGHQDLALSLQRPDGSVLYESTAAVAAIERPREVRFEVVFPSATSTTLSASLTLDTRDDRSLLQRLGFTLLAAAVLGTMLGSAGGFLLVRIGLRPVRQLVEQTRRLAADTLHQRLDGSAQPEELEPLIAQFNDLLGRLAQAYEQLEGFNADVAHELCTPLATLIGSTELALRKARGTQEMREVLGCNLEELQRIAGIVQDMLFLSYANHGASARRMPTPSLAAVARLVGDYHEAALADADLHFQVIGDAAGAFDVPLLQRALSNLVANASRFAERGTTVRIEISETPDGTITLTTVDHGVTVAPEHLPRLFDRFYRSDRSRRDAAQNHGLGLSIVAAIARMHGGQPFARSAGGVTSIGLTLRKAAPATPTLPNPLHSSAQATGTTQSAQAGG